MSPQRGRRPPTGRVPRAGRDPAHHGLAELKRLLARAGVKPSRRLGQNFMIDPNLVRYLVKQADLFPGEVVLEVGAGTGILTAGLASAGARVVGVEVDRRLAGVLQERFGDERLVTVLAASALDRSREVSPAVAKEIGNAMRLFGATQFAVVSNLPYCCATPFLASLASSPLAWRTALVTVQREVGERLAAEPGSKVYGTASVLVQTGAKVEMMRRIPPAVFWPRPEVESALLRLRPIYRRSFDPRAFAAFVRGLFSHRRKQLGAALRHAGYALTGASRFDLEARPEEFSPEAFVEMFGHAKKAAAGKAQDLRKRPLPPGKGAAAHR